MSWLKTGNLGCDTCDAVLDHPGPRVLVLNAARAKGWHVFTGKSLTDKPIDTHVCPDCIGTNRSSKTKPAPSLDGDVTLF